MNNGKSDGSKQLISMCSLVFVLFINAILFLVWILAMKSSQEFDEYDFIQDLPSVIGGLATLSATIWAVHVAWDWKYRFGGSKFYPRKYGENALNNILNKYNEVEDYESKVNIVYTLMNQSSMFHNPSRYFDYTNILQDSSFDFKKVWNDYNYYTVKPIRSSKISNYVFRLQRYIFMNVYEINNRLNNLH